MAGQWKADLSLVLENKQLMVCFISETELKTPPLSDTIPPSTFDPALGMLLPVTSESSCLLGGVIRASLLCSTGCIG